MNTQKSLARIVLEPLGVAVIAAMCLRALVHAYSIPSPSMEPTLLAGDHILVTPYLRWIGAAPARGDVVVFRGDGGGAFVKRVAGLPGDCLEVRGETILVNGKPLEERFLAYRVDNGSLAASVLPEDRYFVLGDNREDSLDSRSFGPVERGAIVGKARLIFWSSTHPGGFEETPAMASSRPAPVPASGVPEVRWERILRRIH